MLQLLYMNSKCLEKAVSMRAALGFGVLRTFLLPGAGEEILYGCLTKSSATKKQRKGVILKYLKAEIMAECFGDSAG